MSMFSVNGASVGDQRLGAEATLNPNAAEFVPSALRPRAASISIPDASSKFAAASPTPGKSVLDRSESSVSANSDEEAQQYWRHQLPDDITPDFKVMGIDDNQDINSSSFSNLSLSDANEGSRYTSSTSSGFMLNGQQGLSLEPLNGNNFAEKLKHPISSYGEYPSPASFQPSIAKPWEKQIVSNNRLLARERLPYNGNSSQRFLADISNEQLLLDNADASPLEFLTSQFPGIAAERLAELFLSSGSDLKRTIEILTQLKVDGGFKTINSKATLSANLRALDFPTQDGFAKPAGDYHQNLSPYQSAVRDSTHLVRSSSIPSRGTIDYASIVRKVASQDSIWKYERTGSLAASIGSSRSPQVLAYNSGRGKGIYGDNLLNRGSAHASPVWRETGEAVANEYSGMLEEARDNARIRNAYYEKARQAYLMGNKALSKELGITGHLQTTPAHGNPQESIYRSRNVDTQANGRERIIDLHGLHVSEAIHVLKRELAVLRIAARSSGQQMLVYIRVGIGHPTRGLRTPAGLPTAVQRYLLEEEGLNYSEPQPGLLCLVIY
ncbi:hypothetical protein ACS0TY_021153 [Phlomoides rotata]